VADATHIEWTDATWNPIAGCSVVSPGCTNCYAMKLAGGRLQHHRSRAGLTTDSKAGPVWNGLVRLNEEWFDQPLRWSRPRRIFVCAHGDLFHESVPDAWIDRVFAVMALAPHHTFQVLTKRAARMRAYVENRAPKLARFMIDEYLIKAPDTAPKGRARNVAWPVKSIGNIDMPDDVTMAEWPLPNVWLGVSAEDQTRADERLPELVATPAAVRFVSLEPLLGPVDITPHLFIYTHEDAYKLAACECDGEDPVLPFRDPATTAPDDIASPRLDLVIVGGENGPRPMHPDWVRDIRDACSDARVAFFFKQWGTWGPGEIAGPIKGPQEGAHWFDARWDIQRYTAGEAEAFTADDEPDVWRLGKAAAGRLLDGVLHDAMPVIPHG